MTAQAGHASSPLRQLTTLAALLEHITASSVLDGAILLGSFARGTPDAASDLDLIVCVGDGHFATAWQQRTALQVTGAMVWWDQHLAPDRVGAHKWVTNELVLVEACWQPPTAACGWHRRTGSSPANRGLPSGSLLVHPSSAPSWASTCIPLNAPMTSSRR